MTILLAGTGNDYVNYQNILDRMGMPYRLALESDGSESALLLPGGGDVFPGFYGEEINGSLEPDKELDEKQLALCKLFLRQKKPILGICRGCQLLNVALGGTLIQNLLFAENHKRKADGAENFHEVTGREDSLMRKLWGIHFRVNSSHHQACNRLGEGLVPTLFAEDGTIEAVEHSSLPVVGVQFHPERLAKDGLPPRTADGKLIFAWLKSLLSD